MAGLIVGKLGFGKDDFFYGLELCLHKAGRSAYSVTPMTAPACDVLLVTMFWYRDIYLLEAFLRDARIRKGDKPLIIAGGMQATMTPEIISRMVDCVFVGDADDHLGAILDQIERGEKPEHSSLYRESDERVPAPAECAPSAFAMQKGGRRDVVRIEIARGCRFSCGFCALAGLKKYREVPFLEIKPLLDSTAPKPCSLFAPERTLHSEWVQFKRALAEHGRRDLGQDVRLEGLGKIESNSVTFGLEGISYRLRKLIGKPFRSDYILGQLRKWVESRSGIAFMSAYFIADLPGEDESDWDEMKALFESIEQANWSRKLTLKPVLNPFSPKAFTTLSGAVIHPFRDYRDRWRKFLRHNGGQWGFRIVETLVWGPFERIMDVIVERGGKSAYEVVRRLPRKLLTGKPSMVENEPTARQILSESRRFGLTDELLGIA
jgi:radical SAM superfamily enzyme YgiQ (UPF0313 family)